MAANLDSMNRRIEAEFEACGYAYEIDGWRPLWVEIDDDDRLWLNDNSVRILVDLDECLDGGIEQVTRDWINAVMD